MTFELFKGNAVAISDKLNGAIVLGPIPARGLPVGGRTLVFSNPSAVVTFSGLLNSMLSPATILAEIQAEVPEIFYAIRSGTGLSVSIPGTFPTITMALWSEAGFEIDVSGTANGYFGISQNAVATGAIDRGRVIALTQGTPADNYTLLLGDGSAAAADGTSLYIEPVDTSSLSSGLFVHKVEPGTPTYADARTYPETLAIGLYDGTPNKLLVHGLAEAQFSLASAMPAPGDPVFLARASDDGGLAALGKATVSPPSQDFVSRVGMVAFTPVDYTSTRKAMIVLSTPTRDVLQLAGP